MPEPPQPRICDELLQPLLAESKEAEIELLLSNLIQNSASPVIAGILKQKFSGWGNVDLDDLQSEVMLRLIARLRQFKQNPEVYSIWNFREYVVATTGRVCVNYLRSQFPNRCRLKNSLMYLLTRDSSFFVKQTESGIQICGLSKWEKSEKAIAFDIENLKLEKVRSKLKTGYQNAGSLRLALLEIFAASRSPVEMNDLLKIMTAIFNVQDRPAKLQKEVEVNIFDMISDQRDNPEEIAEKSQFLTKMWNEIIQLPVKQRAALLLNLRDSDGRDLLSVFPLSGIATYREIAKILELPLDQFAEIWKEIPLGDLRIAELLGVSRQQVINFRKSGRERLMRRANEDRTNKNKKLSSLE
jgi:RNA polymerase sigma factor (sigma-70 family)